MSKTKEAEAFGNLLIGMFAEFKKAEETLPEGFSPSELTRTIGCLDGEWAITVSRPEGDEV